MTSTEHATGTLKTSTWKEEPFAEIEGAPKLSHDRVSQTFTGDIEGEGTWQGLNAYRDEASAIFVGFERVDGRVGGRSGSFVLQVSGTYENGEARIRWSVVPGTGTGELRGIRGDGTYLAAGSFEDGYSYDLDYHFD
ncbi:MAG: DUF3224 domain-containing protein [Candidatus Dormibacteraeota bacterium]|nr:DUF3224 domain-containing protein [Candidatus Dormibacteraeota bacterium]